MLLIGAAGAAVAFKQRETLRIAADLEQARTSGAKSYTQLETCNAAHASDQEALAECRASGDKARDDLKQQLDGVMRTGSTSQAEHAREVQKFLGRIRTCEENATTAKRVCDDETQRLATQAANDKTVAADQQRELEKAVEQCRAELLAATAERDKARADRAACVEERDACKAEAKEAPPASPSKAPPRGPASALPDPAYANEDTVTPPQLKEAHPKPDEPKAPAPPPPDPASPAPPPVKTAAVKTAAAKGPAAKVPAARAKAKAPPSRTICRDRRPMYRLPAREGPRGSAGYVTLRRYLDPIEAQLDRARLEAEDIPARVIEPTGFNPALTLAAGGVTLDVRAEDALRAERILAEPGVDLTVGGDDDPDDGPDAVRCPRCELPYCTFERPKLRGLAPGGIGLLHLLAYGLGAAAPKRWRCQRCEHVWDDPAEGPKTMTRLAPGDPRPVFRLRRAHAGMGVFLGVMAGFFAVILLHGPGAVLLFVAPVLGWALGRSIGADVCSEPRCREPLSPRAEACPGCKGSVAGRVRSAAEHYAAAADFRRELAALRARDAEKGKRRLKKKGSGA